MLKRRAVIGLKKVSAIFLTNQNPNLLERDLLTCAACDVFALNSNWFNYFVLMISVYNTQLKTAQTWITNLCWACIHHG